jgi:hypothetical protein
MPLIGWKEFWLHSPIEWMMWCSSEWLVQRRWHEIIKLRKFVQVFRFGISSKQAHHWLGLPGHCRHSRTIPLWIICSWQRRSGGFHCQFVLRSLGPVRRCWAAIWEERRESTVSNKDSCPVSINPLVTCQKLLRASQRDQHLRSNIKPESAGTIRKQIGRWDIASHYNIPYEIFGILWIYQAPYVRLILHTTRPNSYYPSP